MVARAAVRLDVSQLPPNIFAIVMATGIVSLAAGGAGYQAVAKVLFVLNALLYALLLGLLILRTLAHREPLVADLRSHAKAPGFFTMVAGPCVLGVQFLLLARSPAIAAVLLAIGLAFWLALTYLMLPGLMTGNPKPPPERGLSGAWLLVVVGTQALSVLTCLLAPQVSAAAEGVLFAALAFWLIGSMIYLWIISQIFHRILFLPLVAGDLTPPYWINMGAMAIATLAGTRLIGASEQSELLASLSPFLKGMTLLFWATATWWIPILIALGVWRHLWQRTPLAYEHGFWAAVFPLGMYTVCTQRLIEVLPAPYLQFIPAAFVWIALAAWTATFIGLVRHAARSMFSQAAASPAPHAPADPPHAKIS